MMKCEVDRARYAGCHYMVVEVEQTLQCAIRCRETFAGFVSI
jgi:hypothetical protein